VQVGIEWTSIDQGFSQDGIFEQDKDADLKYLFWGTFLLLCGLFIFWIASSPERSHAGKATLSLEERKDSKDLRGGIEVWSWNIAAASLKKVVPGFNQTYPSVDVYINMTGANMQTRFFLSLCAGVGGPDVMQLQSVEGPQYTAAGRLTDLTSVAAQYEKVFAPAFWKNCLYEGKVYAIPWDMGPCAVFYKRDLFERYGIDPTAIATWDDFIQVGEVILEKSNGKTKLFHLPTSHGMFSVFEILLQQAKGQIFDDQGRISIYSPEAVEVVTLLRRLLDAKICSNVNTFTAEYFASLQNETVACYPTAVWFGGSIKDYAKPTSGNWGVFRLPALHEGGLRVSNLGGSILVIPDQCQNKEAAWAYVEYALCTKEGQLEQYKHFDLFPSLMTTFDDPFFQEGDPFYAGQKVRQLFAQDIEKMHVLNRTEHWNEATRYLGQALSLWANTEESPQDFLVNVEAKLQRRIGLAISENSLSQKVGS